MLESRAVELVHFMLLELYLLRGLQTMLCSYWQLQPWVSASHTIY